MSVRVHVDSEDMTGNYCLAIAYIKHNVANTDDGAICDGEIWDEVNSSELQEDFDIMQDRAQVDLHSPQSPGSRVHLTTQSYCFYHFWESGQHFIKFLIIHLTLSLDS